MENYDVIIIGGGLSGIKSFVDLKKNGLSVLMIEKSSYIGGRAFSFKDPLTGNYIDNGQHVIVGACKEYLNLLEETNNEENFIKIKKLNMHLHITTQPIQWLDKQKFLWKEVN